MRDNPNNFKSGDIVILDEGTINAKVKIKFITENGKISTIIVIGKKGDPWDVKTNRLSPIKNGSSIIQKQGAQ